ncbi:ribose 1,5-bisphosphokinase [Kushneria phosphatilytica]|uniref:Ribose 1,5-bisphosphate phosphokinase PhnN n=1 Tax=Kushneria phosphatilytica TaxID=657387 RepID=A0A1S1NWG7_9GAMM|nr:ribose 1,5-bisphosphokinase [Kushneria phosphatilytica]OHV08638.1 phosphonate metabolism protein/1,5-bisphosphokinase (PRPP-forming) PhnN [Kushneria phosphatilytica]QEL12349.1 ribose 1,5-bisphosphokinase [Kushneria phosphatilytica]
MSRLIYLMGASGVGKDSLLRGLREMAPERLVAHRYITRRGTLDEQHIALSEAEFERRHAAGLFCLHWHAHGLRYGVGIEITQWLALGHSVIVNGSRGHLDTARRRFDVQLTPLLITAEEPVIRERLKRRGRESDDEIEARLRRHHDETASLPDDVNRLDNSTTLDAGVTRLCHWLDALDSTVLPATPHLRPLTSGAPS